jgi:hypothetical protein
MNDRQRERERRAQERRERDPFYDPTRIPEKVSPWPVILAVLAFIIALYLMR